MKRCPTKKSSHPFLTVSLFIVAEYTIRFLRVDKLIFRAVQLFIECWKVTLVFLSPMKNNEHINSERRKFSLNLARALAKMIAAEDYAAMNADEEQEP